MGQLSYSIFSRTIEQHTYRHAHCSCKNNCINLLLNSLSVCVNEKHFVNLIQFIQAHAVSMYTIFYSTLGSARTDTNTIEESKNIHKVSIEMLDETKFPIDYIGNCWLFCMARDSSNDGVNKDIIFEMRRNHSIKNDRAISFWNTIYHAINLSQCVAVRESFAKNFFFVKSWFFFRLHHNEFHFAEKIVCGVCLFFFCFAWFNRIYT